MKTNNFTQSRIIGLFLSGATGSTAKKRNLVEWNHRVGDRKDEVDVVLRHLVCDQRKRWVVLWDKSDHAVRSKEDIIC